MVRKNTGSDSALNQKHDNTDIIVLLPIHKCFNYKLHIVRIITLCSEKFLWSNIVVRLLSGGQTLVKHCKEFLIICHLLTIILTLSKCFFSFKMVPSLKIHLMTLSCPPHHWPGKLLPKYSSTFKGSNLIIRIPEPFSLFPCHLTLEGEVAAAVIMWFNYL